MMPATMIRIADAVTAMLNEANLSQPFTAVRRYLPLFELAEMDELRVSVTPRELASQGLSRSKDAYEYRIDVAVQRRVSLDNEPLDALMALVEEIVDLFGEGSVSGLPEARCVNVENAPVYAPEHLDEFRQFTSVVTLTFRVWR